MAQDLESIVGEWAFDPVDESRNVRKVEGDDGREKLQVRIRNGLLQWQLDGRPDGARPHGFDSLLQYYRHLLQRHRVRRRRGRGFRLTRAQVDAAAEELLDYYQRRVALFLIGDFERARDDAIHNLEMMDFLHVYAPRLRAVREHERYRPFVIMDRARAEAALAIHRKEFRQSIEHLDRGANEIVQFYRGQHREDAIKNCEELKVLRTIKDRLRQEYNIPLTEREQLETLREQLQSAIDEEDYERAATLRDQIRLHERNSGNIAQSNL